MEDYHKHSDQLHIEKKFDSIRGIVIMGHCLICGKKVTETVLTY